MEFGFLWNLKDAVVATRAAAGSQECVMLDLTHPAGKTVMV